MLQHRHRHELSWSMMIYLLFGMKTITSHFDLWGTLWLIVSFGKTGGEREISICSLTKNSSIYRVVLANPSDLWEVRGIVSNYLKVPVCWKILKGFIELFHHQRSLSFSVRASLRQTENDIVRTDRWDQRDSSWLSPQCVVKIDRWYDIN